MDEKGAKVAYEVGRVADAITANAAIGHDETGGAVASLTEAVMPAHFNEEALLATERLVRGAQKEGTKMAVASDKVHEVIPTTQTVSNIRKVVEKARIHLDYGTLEGRLEEVSVHGGPHFTIWEVLTNHRIDCAVTLERLEEAKALLGRRVAVSGRVRYRNHKPTSIQVENIRRLRDASELPQLENMPPIDIAGGLSPEEYVRRMRDARQGDGL